MRAAVVGGGVAGAALAWRLRTAGVDVTVYAPDAADASGASGGLVRGFEVDAEAAGQAAESLAELRSDERVRDWAGYRETGSVYVTAEGVTPSVDAVEAALPGSASVVDGAELARRFGFRDLPADAAGVVERHAGHFSPARFRERALRWLAGSGGDVRAERVAEVRAGAAVRTEGGVAAFDAVVVAAGAWTPRLVGGEPLRAKQIQYGLYRLPIPCAASFVDDRTGLYGRPDRDGAFLLGMGCDRWDVDPDAVTPDHDLAGRVLDAARRRFGVADGAAGPERVVASFDCYRSPAGLRLVDVGGGVFTFTGGSGGAAKTVLAASRRAAAELVAS
ncbi:FAD-dependent oxidoreductase [Actinosynnema sp. NPDC053489]|uniref:FAD-dependent oxidoreductase n=1 Tax=Actinosynnema sp. NPDC053489 TaxID=3363916 RepID=UPI0037C9B763